MNIEEQNKIVSVNTYTKVATISVDELDTLYIVRHYTGLGSVIKWVSVYVLCDHSNRQSYLGCFEMQTKPSEDPVWVPSEKHLKVQKENLDLYNKEVETFKRIRLIMLNALDKVWK